MSILMATAPSAPLAPVRISRPATEHTFTSWDGTPLFYRAWLPRDASPAGSDGAASARPAASVANHALLLIHRGHEHSGRFQELVDLLGLDDVAIFAWDARGHGRSPGERGYAHDLSCVVRDLDAFAAHVRERYEVPMHDTAVLAHSVGAVVAAAWVHDYAPPIRALVLASPAFRVKLYVPLAIPALRLLMRVRRKAFVKSYVKASMLTHDPEQAAAYQRDPLISRGIAVNILLDLHDTASRLLADAGAIDVPTLLLAASSDWVVHNRPQRKFFERLASSQKQMHAYDGFYHGIFHERERRRSAADVRRFLLEAFARPAMTRSCTDADRAGYTRSEFERLGRALPVYCPRRLNFTGQRAFLKTVGRLSDGVQIGWQHGFDSGQSLDYIYRNRPRGITPLGKLIDWFYLNAVGWRGIRQRKAHLEAALESAVRRVAMEPARPAGDAVQIVDIAAGPGRYLLDALERVPGVPVRALLRDRNLDGLERGRALAAQMGLQERVTYEAGDAFDEAALAALTPRPDIAVVSGLYELFADNELILQSLRGLSAALEPGGILIYTNQPWHPQVEMIARVLDNRDGKRWVMRRRTQAEMDDLVRAAGFRKESMQIDRWGIFTVSVARR